MSFCRRGSVLVMMNSGLAIFSRWQQGPCQSKVFVWTGGRAVVRNRTYKSHRTHTTPAKMPTTQRYKLTIAYRGTRYHGWQHQSVNMLTWKGEMPPEGQ